jgi:hypothetical protein
METVTMTQKELREIARNVLADYLKLKTPDDVQPAPVLAAISVLHAPERDGDDDARR